MKPAKRLESAETREAFLAECLTINDRDLNSEFIQIPSQIAYWTEQLANAVFAHESAKLTYEREHARMFVLLRNKTEETSKRPLAVEAIKALCDNDEDLYELQLETLRRDAERIRIRGICDAVARKADMLQSLGAKIREEHRADLSIRRAELERTLTGNDR